MPPWSVPLYLVSLLLCLFLFVVLRFRDGPNRTKVNPLVVASLVLGSPAVGLGAANLVYFALK
jgi:hypothetical protein